MTHGKGKMSGKRYAKFLIPTLLVSAGVISLAYYFQKKNNGNFSHSQVKSS